MFKYAPTFALALLINAGSTSAQNQPTGQSSPRPAADSEPQVTRVIRIEGTSPKALEHALLQTFGDLNVSAVDGTQVMVLRGTADDVAQAQSLIEQITSQFRAGDSTKIQLFHLSHARPQDVAGQLQSAFAGSEVTIAPDPQRNSILVRGLPATIAGIAELIGKLDTQAPGDMTTNVSIEFSFLTAGPDKPDAGMELPSDLAEVGKELSRFGTIKLMGRLKTVTTKDKQFEIEGMISDKFTVRVKGRLMSVHSDGAMVELDAMAIAYRTPSPNETPGLGEPPAGRTKSSAYNIRTTLQLKANNDLAVGVAPAGAHIGSSLVLVVRASW